LFGGLKQVPCADEVGPVAHSEAVIFDRRRGFCREANAERGSARARFAFGEQALAGDTEEPRSGIVFVGGKRVESTPGDKERLVGNVFCAVFFRDAALDELED
jgi:hypothetical protein